MISLVGSFSSHTPPSTRIAVRLAQLVKGENTPAEFDAIYADPTLTRHDADDYRFQLVVVGVASAGVCTFPTPVGASWCQLVVSSSEHFRASCRQLAISDACVLSRVQEVWGSTP